MYHITKHSFIVHNTKKHNSLSVLFWERDKRSHMQLIFLLKQQLEKQGDSLEKQNLKAIGTLYYNPLSQRTIILCTACRKEEQEEFKGTILIQQKFEEIYYNLVKEHFTHALSRYYLTKHISSKNQLRPQKQTHCL